MSIWECLKEAPQVLLLREIAAFLLCMAGLLGFFIIAYGFVGG